MKRKPLDSPKKGLLMSIMSGLVMALTACDSESSKIEPEVTKEQRQKVDDFIATYRDSLSVNFIDERKSSGDRSLGESGYSVIEGAPKSGRVELSGNSLNMILSDYSNDADPVRNRDYWDSLVGFAEASTRGKVRAEELIMIEPNARSITRYASTNFTAYLIENSSGRIHGVFWFSQGDNSVLFEVKNGGLSDAIKGLRWLSVSENSAIAKFRAGGSP